MASERTPAWKISTFGVTSGVSANEANRCPIGDDPAARSVEGGAADHGRPPAHHGGVDARVGGHRRESPVVPAPHVEFGGVAARVGLERDAGLRHVDDRTHLEVDRGDRLAADQQAPGAVARSAGHHESTVGQQRRDTRARGRSTRPRTRWRGRRFRRWRCRRAAPSCCAGRATGRASRARRRSSRQWRRTGRTRGPSRRRRARRRARARAA